jgi:organic radical activating enzyme
MIFRRSLATLTIACLCTSPVLATQNPTTTTAPTTPAPVTKTTLVDAEKEKDIRQLISMTGGDKIAQQMIDQMIPEMQKVMTEVPPTFWQDFRKKIDMNELNDRLLPVYDKYYSKEPFS